MVGILLSYWDSAYFQGQAVSFREATWLVESQQSLLLGRQTDFTVKVDTDTVPWRWKIQALLVSLGHSFRVYINPLVSKAFHSQLHHFLNEKDLCCWVTCCCCWKRSFQLSQWNGGYRLHVLGVYMCILGSERAYLLLLYTNFFGHPSRSLFFVIS